MLLLFKTVIFNAITFPFIVAKMRRNLDRSQFESYPFKIPVYKAEAFISLVMEMFVLQPLIWQLECT